MADFPSLPLWTDAYLADTTHLTTEEHGAYLLLLIAAWRSPDCCLPDDDTRLARFVRATPRVWARLRPVMATFFTIEGGFWTQKRLSKERKYVTDVSQKRSKAAHAKHLKDKETGAAHAGAHALHPHPHLEESLSTDSQAKEHSVPLERTDEPSKEAPPVDAKTVLWREMKDWLGGKRAGGLVGKWCKEFGEGEVFATYFRARTENPAERVSWMTAALKANAGQRARPPPRATVDGTMRILHEAGLINGERPEDEPDSGLLDAAALGVSLYQLN